MGYQEFIQSDILTNYVLGVGSTEDRQLVEQFLASHPKETLAEIRAIEATLLQFGKMQSKPPPIGLKGKILSSILKEEALKEDIKKTTTGMSPISILALVASLLFLVASIYLWTQLSTEQELNQQNAVALNEATTKLQNCTTEKERYLNTLAIIRNSANQPIALAGQAISPSSAAKIYYNTTDKKTYLDVESLQIPPTDKQYQLWAIVAGTPVSLGVFDVPTDSTLIEVDFVDNPAVFAVTLEQKGGVEQPTLDQMYLAGEVS